MPVLGLICKMGAVGAWYLKYNLCQRRRKNKLKRPKTARRKQPAQASRKTGSARTSHWPSTSSTATWRPTWRSTLCSSPSMCPRCSWGANSSTSRMQPSMSRRDSRRNSGAPGMLSAALTLARISRTKLNVASSSTGVPSGSSFGSSAEWHCQRQVWYSLSNISNL